MESEVVAPTLFGKEYCYITKFSLIPQFSNSVQELQSAITQLRLIYLFEKTYNYPTFWRKLKFEVNLGSEPQKIAYDCYV